MYQDLVSFLILIESTVIHSPLEILVNKRSCILYYLLFVFIFVSLMDNKSLVELVEQLNTKPILIYGKRIIYYEYLLT